MPIPKRHAFTLIAGVTIGMVITVPVGVNLPTALAQDTTVFGATSSEIRFDESGGKRATPVIPKAWRFVGVSNGEKINSNNLWFEDGEGQIFLVQGFTSYGKFTVYSSVAQRLNRR